MSTNSGKNASAKERREKAASARAAQEAAEKRRDRTVKIVGAIGVIVVVGAIIGGVVWSKQSQGSNGNGAASALPSPNPDAPMPKGVVNTGDYAYAIPVGAMKAGTPVLQVWEDPQCPACAAVEKANGAGIEALGTSGQVQLYYRPTAFLDAKLAAENAAKKAPNSSIRAIAAWGCAVDAGKAMEFHNALYAAQPDEGTGYTEQALLDIGKSAGITGDAYTTFEKCVKDGTYVNWAVNTNQLFTDKAIPGTPAAFLDGTEVPNATLADKAKLDALVAEAAKK